MKLINKSFSKKVGVSGVVCNRRNWFFAIAFFNQVLIVGTHKRNGLFLFGRWVYNYSETPAI